MSFESDITDWVRRTTTEVDQFTVVVAEEILTRTKRRTPVLTGALRDSWVIGNSIEDSSGDSGQPGSFRGSNGPVFVLNRQPYARRIEYGYSTKAPAGMLRVSIAEVVQMINSGQIRRK